MTLSGACTTRPSMGWRSTCSRAAPTVYCISTISIGTAATARVKTSPWSTSRASCPGGSRSARCTKPTRSARPGTWPLPTRSRRRASPCTTSSRRRSARSASSATRWTSPRQTRASASSGPKPSKAGGTWPRRSRNSPTSTGTGAGAASRPWIRSCAWRTATRRCATSLGRRVLATPTSWTAWSRFGWQRRSSTFTSSRTSRTRCRWTSSS
mmetsp:Transcript_14476/g.48489  ORF Transcript_14476/g.48489 Transcript_14476/m.48489 type:complete len:211 (+) Transcript_14476:1597-2229(+)